MSQSKNNKDFSVTSGLFWRFGERIAAQVVSFVVSVVLARILMPEDYGAIAILLVFIEIANTLVVSGLSTALIQKKEISQLEMSTVFYCNLALSIVLYAAMFFASPLIARVYELPVLIPATRVFALQLPIFALQSLPNVIISRELNFRKLFFGNIIGTIISAIVGIFLAIKGFGIWALVFQSLSQVAVSTLVLNLIVRWFPSLCFSFKKTKPLIRFGWKVMFSDLVASVSNQFSSLIIGAKYTASDLAYYTKGKQLPTLIRSNLYNTLISVLFPAMSRLNDDIGSLKAFSKRCIRLLFYIACPLMVGLTAVSHNLVLVLYTEKWLQMTPYIAIICVECLLAIPPTIFLQALKAVGKSDIMLKLEMIKKPLLIVSILVAMRFGVFAIALTLPLNTLFDLFLTGFYSKKIFGYGLWEEIKDCLPAIAISAAMFVSVKIVGWLPLSAFLLLVLQCFVGIFVYIGLSILFKNQEFLYLWHMLKSRFVKK